MVPQVTEPSAAVCRAWLEPLQLVREVSLMAEVKAALVEVIETPLALWKLKSAETFKLVEVALRVVRLVKLPFEPVILEP